MSFWVKSCNSHGWFDSVQMNAVFAGQIMLCIQNALLVLLLKANSATYRTSLTTFEAVEGTCNGLPIQLLSSNIILNLLNLIFT